MESTHIDVNFGPSIQCGTSNYFLFLSFSPSVLSAPTFFSLLILLPSLFIFPHPPAAAATTAPALSFHRLLSPQCSWLLLSSGCQHSPYPSFSHSALCEPIAPLLPAFHVCMNASLSRPLCLYYRLAPPGRLLVVTMEVSLDITFPVLTRALFNE